MFEYLTELRKYHKLSLAVCEDGISLLENLLNFLSYLILINLTNWI